MWVNALVVITDDFLKGVGEHRKVGGEKKGGGSIPLTNYALLGLEQVCM